MNALNQLVIFELGNQFYGIDINEVSEIVEKQEVREIPRSPHYVEGITQFRGNVFTIINGRKFLNIQSNDEDAKQEKLIMLHGCKVGIIVDNVTEILPVKEEDKAEVEAVSGISSDYIQYFVKTEDRIITAISVLERLVPNQEKVIA